MKNKVLQNDEDIKPVKLFAGLIISEGILLNEIENMLAKEFHEIDLHSEIVEFDYTDYYYKEMGKPLKRKFISFKEMVMPDKLSLIKKKTCAIESKISRKGKRVVNIDPGYISMAKVVLASTKNFYHRIYLGGGIYAEVTLAWQKGEYRDFEWTFPDYKTPLYKGILTKIRNVYSVQIAGMDEHREK